MRYLYLISILFCLNSCHKVKFTGDFATLVGDYEWVYSEMGSTEYILAESHPDKYGVRITKKSKIIFFKNGVQTEKYRINHSSYNADDEIGLTFNKEGGYLQNNVKIKNGILKLSMYPFNSDKNMFSKK
ncbi:MAG: hypothetical protein WC044_08380 [Crocinitomicaceae bacterium]